MKVAIIGFARQGISAYRFYALRGADITICDQKDNLDGVPNGAELQLGASYLDNLDRFDIIVRTPFLHPNKIVEANPDSPDILSKVTTATNLFFETVEAPIIGVTGTKGKGTTSLLITAMLQAAGLKVALGGNIGLSPLDMLQESEAADFIVLELSNFQTMDMQYSPNIGVCLNMSREHLDWHTDYEEYLQAKAQMFANQASSDIAIYYCNSDDSRRVVSSTPASNLLSYSSDSSTADVTIKNDIIYYKEEEIARVDDIKLLGKHNQQNVCAAIAAVWNIIQPNKQAIVDALHASSGFPMRLQTVHTIDNVSYINDSFASAPEASIAALKAVESPLVLIVGGHDKGVDLQPFADAIAASSVKHLVAIGDTGPKIAELVQIINPDITCTTGLTDMPAMIANAKEHAERGDSVLLSTGSASFGLFANYEDRGKQFNAAVEAL